jgi:hypothetical protein
VLLPAGNGNDSSNTSIGGNDLAATGGPLQVASPPLSQMQLLQHTNLTFQGVMLLLVRALCTLFS